MKNSFWLLLFFSWFTFGCKEKKPSLTGDGPQTAKEFVGSFTELTLPFSLEDTAVGKKAADSVKIPAAIIAKFLPDTLFRAAFGKTVPTIYPIGKITVKEKETYLLVKAISSHRQA